MELAILDDSEQQRDLNKAFFEMELESDYEVHAYEGLEEARSQSEEFETEIDALVTDYDMPDYSGVQVAEEVFGKDDSVPIIIYSGSNFQEIRQELESAGISEDDLLGIERKRADTDQYRKMAEKIEDAVD